MKERRVNRDSEERKKKKMKNYNSAFQKKRENRIKRKIKKENEYEVRISVKDLEKE